MALYQTDEAVFDLTESWTDQSVNIFGLGPMGNRIGLVMSRDELPAGSTLEAFVAKHLKDQKQKIRNFKLLGQRSSTVGGLPAIEAKLHGLHDGQMMFHHQCFVEYYGKVLTFSLTSKLAKAAQGEALITQILSTVKFRRV